MSSKVPEANPFSDPLLRDLFPAVCRSAEKGNKLAETIVDSVLDDLYIKEKATELAAAEEKKKKL